ncbi:MAG: hypothetical protein R2770_14920 [Acidimicrobiales bacterium]
MLDLKVGGVAQEPLENIIGEARGVSAVLVEGYLITIDDDRSDEHGSNCDFDSNRGDGSASIICSTPTRCPP